MFTFLPLYFAKAIGNASVGLQNSLTLLIDILSLAESCHVLDVSTTIVVDISDLAAFAAEVRDPRVFALCAQHLSIEQVGTEIKLWVVKKHWLRVNLTNFSDDTMLQVVDSLRQADRRASELEATVTNFIVSQQNVAQAPSANSRVAAAVGAQSQDEWCV